MDWRDFIIADPAILVGKPTVRGTRLGVEFLLGLFAEGWTIEQVLRNYPALTPEALKAVFAFARESVTDGAIQPLRRGAA